MTLVEITVGQDYYLNWNLFHGAGHAEECLSLFINVYPSFQTV